MSKHLSNMPRKAVFLTLDSNVDRETRHLELLRVLVSVLKTPDTKEMALAECVAYTKGYNQYQASKKMLNGLFYNVFVSMNL